MRIFKFLEKFGDDFFKENWFIILLVIGVILVIYFFYKKDKWLNYRLGDILRGWLKKNGSTKYLNNIEKKLPNSIAAKYLKETKNLEPKIYYNIIKSILNDLQYEKPNDNDIIIHLRIGDSITDINNNSINYLKNANNEVYATIIENLEKTLQLLDKKNRCVLVYGTHINLSKKQKENTKLYLNKIRELLKKYNFKFIEKINRNPDEDFYYMANSKIFIKSGGGYSTIISNIITNNGGLVYYPNSILEKENFTWGGENWYL